MSTAREHLYVEFCELLSTPINSEAESKLKKLIDRYRIQKKSGGSDESGLTARELLAQEMYFFWEAQNTGIKEEIQQSMNAFKMQYKKSSKIKEKKTTKEVKINNSITDKSDLLAKIAAKKRERPEKTGSNKENTLKTKISQNKSLTKIPTNHPKKQVEKRAQKSFKNSLHTHQDEEREIGKSPLLSPLQRNKKMQSEPITMQIAGGPKKRSPPQQECPKCKSMGVSYTQSYTGSSYFSCVYCGWQSLAKEKQDSTAEMASRLLGKTAADDKS